MNNTDIQALLADYAAPTPEDGFSDAVMRTLRAEETSVDLADYMGAPVRPWRSWVIALVVGLIGGLVWKQTGVAMPDISAELSRTEVSSRDLMLYLAGGLSVAASLLFIEMDSA